MVGVLTGVVAQEAACSNATHPSKPTGTCQRAVLEGSVHAGEGFVRPIGEGLKVVLEPLGWGSGWLLRVLPVNGPRPEHDYAELATPPYASVSPLLISTDFSFRAQDAVAWNPRQFRFAANAGDFERMRALYERYMHGSSRNAEIENELAETVSRAPAGVIQILDASLVPGTANQAKMAAAVASHFSTTAHTVEEPAEGNGSTLGRLTWIRFRIGFDLPLGFRVDRGMALSHKQCQ
jgi:hypothetical protein